MKKSCLFLGLLLFLFPTIQGQIVLLNSSETFQYKVADNTRQSIHLNPDVMGLVAFDDVEQRLYWLSSSFVGLGFITANSDGSFPTALYPADVNELSTGWVHDFAKREHYYFYNGGVVRQSYDNFEQTTVVPDISEEGSGLAIDFAQQWVYWTESSTNTVNRYNMSTATREELIKIPSGLSDPTGLALDLTNSKLYFADRGRGKILRANLDGSGLEEIHTGLQAPENIAVDPNRNRLIWTDIGELAIKMSDLDGNNIQTLVGTGLNKPYGLAIDKSSGELYWSNSAGVGLTIGNNIVSRINPSTLDEQLIHFGSSDIFTMVVDPVNEYIFYAENFGRVWRTNIDGSAPVILYEDRTLMNRSIYAVDPINQFLFSSEGNQLYRSDLEGKNRTPFFTPSEQIYHTEIDLNAGRIYWSFSPSGKFGYVDLDGNNLTFVVEDQNIGAFKVDRKNGVVYFQNRTDQRIKKMNVDGSSIEPILVANAKQLFIDVPNNQIFWEEGQTIYQAELNGYNQTVYVENVFQNRYAFLGLSGGNLVPLNSHEVSEINGQIRLNWSLDPGFLSGLAGNELIQVEKRQNVFSWSPLGAISSTPGQQDFTFTDTDPLPGVNEYRIRYVSSSGEVAYSPTLQVDVTVGHRPVEALKANDFSFVNTGDQLIGQGLPGTIEIFSITGKPLSYYKMQDNTFQLTISDLAVGTYVLRHTPFEKNKGSWSQTFVKL